MKQTEKLDSILRNAYKEYTNSGSMGYFDINELLAEDNQKVSHDECYALGKRLESEGLIRLIGSKDGVSIELTSYGLEYCETESHSQPSTPLIQIINNNINNSPNSNLVSNSAGTTINQTSGIDDFKSLLQEITAKLNTAQDIDESVRILALERVDEILGYTEARNSVPKRSLLDFIGMAGDLSSVASLVIALQPFVSGL